MIMIIMTTVGIIVFMLMVRILILTADNECFSALVMMMITIIMTMMIMTNAMIIVFMLMRRILIR